MTGLGSSIDPILVVRSTAHQIGERELVAACRRGTPAGTGPAARWRPLGHPVGRGERGRDGGEARHAVHVRGPRGCAMPSARGPRPRGVLTTRSTLPDEIRSTASTPMPLADLRDHRRRPGRRCASRCAAVPAVATIANPSSTKRRAATTPAALSRSASDRNTVPVARQPVARGDLALGERQAERAVDAHDLAGRAHLGAEHGVDVGEAVERQHRLLHRDVARRRPAGAADPRRAARRASRRPSPGPRPSRAARRSPCSRTAPCGSRAGSPRSRTPGRPSPRTAR